MFDLHVLKALEDKLGKEVADVLNAVHEKVFPTPVKEEEEAG